MDRKNEVFPNIVAERVMKYASVTLFKHPQLLAKVTYDLMGVVMEGVSLEDCQEAVDSTFDYYSTQYKHLNTSL